jgi:5-methylthioadenosine/S-adenosylhomocysteine deaminase
MDVKLLHATVLTQNDRREVIDDGGVAVVGGRIAAVGPSAEIERAHARFPPSSFRARRCCRLWSMRTPTCCSSSLRGTVEDMGAEAIYGYMSPISFAMNDDERRALALLGVAEALRSGTSTLVEPFRHVVNYAGAMAQTGMRLWFAENCADALTLKIRHGIYEFDQAWGETFLARERALIENSTALTMDACSARWPRMRRTTARRGCCGS